MRKKAERVYYAAVPSPLGQIMVASTEIGVCRVAIPSESPDEFFAWIDKTFGSNQAVMSAERNRQVTEQLLEFLAGCRRTFDLTLDLRGSAFQRRVWGALLQVPFGRVCSYQEIAIAVGSPRACRAVGGAVGKNPLPMIVPCHRIIGKDGSLTGFSSGLEAKRFLLRLEAL